MRWRPLGIVIVSALMVIFGVAEVVTSFRHEFFGLSTETSLASTVTGALVGLLYVPPAPSRSSRGAEPCGLPSLVWGSTSSGAC